MVVLTLLISLLFLLLLVCTIFGEEMGDCTVRVSELPVDAIGTAEAPAFDLG